LIVKKAKEEINTASYDELSDCLLNYGSISTHRKIRQFISCY